MGKIVTTSYCVASGQGTPIFSRVGVLSTVEKVEFHNPPKIQVDSTFEKERKARALAAMERIEEEVLDLKTINSFKYGAG